MTDESHAIHFPQDFAAAFGRPDSGRPRRRAAHTKDRRPAPILSPIQPTAERLNEINRDAKFWDKLAERYSKKPIEDEAAYRKKLQITQSYLSPDMEVMEFGCGTGGTALIHAPHVRHILATDASSKMLQIARGKAEAQGIENVTFMQATLDDLAHRRGTYDAILGLSILHLLQNKETAIAQVYDMLKPGGLFISSTVCLGDGMSYFKLIVPIGQLFGLMPYVAVFSAQELQTRLTEAGFDIDHAWQPSKRVTFLIAKKPG